MPRLGTSAADADTKSGTWVRHSRSPLTLELVLDFVGERAKKDLATHIPMYPEIYNTGFWNVRSVKGAVTWQSYEPEFW